LSLPLAKPFPHVSTQPGRKETKLLPHGAAALDENGEVPESCRLPEAEQTARTGMSISLEEGRRIERRDVGWVIVDPSTGCLFEIERCMWSSDEPLVFKTPAGALAAFLRAREHEEGRKRATERR